MNRANIIPLIACVALAATGCGTSTTNSGGSGGSPGTPALEPLSEAPTFAVVSNDLNFSETSVATLNADFEVLDDSWIDSGTSVPGLVATLSGDVVLPTRQQDDGTFTLIDRLQTDVVSQFYVPSGNLNGQVRTQEPDGDFNSDPHDFVAVDETSAWVTRYNQNTNEAAPPINMGTDLFEIDPSTMTATGNRIDLSQFNTTVSVDGQPVPVFAGPDRAVLVRSIMVVGLDRFNAFQGGIAQGASAIVDLTDESVSELPLDDGLANCGNVTPVPGSPNKVMVGCAGAANPFGEPVQTRASAGFVLLDVGADGATIERTWRASTDESSALAVNNHITVDESWVAGVQFGDFGMGTPDQLYLTNIETGDQTIVHTSEGPFQIGESAYDPTTGRLYVPDSDANAVFVYEASEGEVTEIESVTIGANAAFLPRYVYYLR